MNAAAGKPRPDTRPPTNAVTRTETPPRTAAAAGGRVAHIGTSARGRSADNPAGQVARNARSGAVMQVVLAQRFLAVRFFLPSPSHSVSLFSIVPCGW